MIIEMDKKDLRTLSIHYRCCNCGGIGLISRGMECEIVCDKCGRVIATIRDDKVLNIGHWSIMDIGKRKESDERIEPFEVVVGADVEGKA